MTGAQMGLIGGIVGTLIGVIGGIIGTWASIRNCENEEQRRLIIRMSGIMWILAIVFLVAIILSATGRISEWYRWGALGLFWLFMAPAIIYTNKKYTELSARGDLNVKNHSDNSAA